MLMLNDGSNISTGLIDHILLACDLADDIAKFM